MSACKTKTYGCVPIILSLQSQEDMQAISVIYLIVCHLWRRGDRVAGACLAYAGPVLAPGVVVPVVTAVPSVGGVDGFAPVAKHSGKEHHGNHDGVGDDKD